MKHVFTFALLIIASLGVTAQKGYCFSASTRGSFENTKAAKFDKIKTNTEQTNIYTFSFNDSMLVHHIVKESGTICQFYRIESVEKINSYSFFITVISGASGSEYYYYLSDLESDFQFYQIDATTDNDKMTGTKFGTFGNIDLIPYNQ
tara:strand:+ start:117797 stop:118240 length:444 start_codon:yes stop_codon:yes gene_type:complete